MPRIVTVLRVMIVLCLFLLLAPPRAGAQPGWVKQAILDASDKKLHKDAPAVIIYDTDEVKISSDGQTRHKIRIAVKILTPEGINEAILHAPTSPFKPVKKVQGWLITPGGETKKLKRENIVEVALEQAAGFYDDRRTLVASFDDVGIGDVVAFEFQVDEKNKGEGFHQSFTFQSDLPVISSRFEMTVPKNWLINAAGQFLEPVNYSTEGNRHIWQAGYMAYRPDEVNMPPAGEVSRHLHITCYSPDDERSKFLESWQGISQWAWERHQNEAAVDHTIRKEATTLIKGLDSPLDRLTAVAHYVRDDIRYVAVELDEGRFRPRAATTTYFNRYGDCKDKVTLMRAMLSAIDIPSQPVLALSGGNILEEVPSPFQFNHVIIAIPIESVPGLETHTMAIVDGWLYFDPTDQTTSLGRVPTHLCGKKVLKMSDTDTALVTLPPLDPGEHRRVYRATAALDFDNSITAEVIIVDYGNRAGETKFRNSLTPVEEWVESWQEVFSHSMQNPRVTDYKAESDEDSCWISFKLKGQNYLTSAGDLHLLKLDFIHEDWTDEMTGDERVHPIYFRTPGIIDTEIEWTLPEGWVFTENPRPIKSECEIARINGRTESTGANLRLQSTVTYRGGTLPVAKFAEARTYYRQALAARGMRAIINKE